MASYIFRGCVLTIGLMIADLVNASAQLDSAQITEPPAIQLIARPLPDAIMLRWAPDNPTVWQYANRYGYHIERVTLLRDGQVLSSPERKQLTTEPLKPFLLSQWEALADTNDYAAVAAQAIYGETFELTENYSSDIMQVVNKARELTSRFSFALFAADQSPAVARASGLHYVDQAVAPNEKYVYRVYAALPPTVDTAVDTGFVYTGVMDYQELPVPLYLEAEFGDRSVQLRWDGSLLAHVFSSYLVERSDDEGKMFHRVDQAPFVNTQTSDTPAQYVHKVDTLPDNTRPYLYRVRGITPFGEISEPSETVRGTGKIALHANPAIIKAEALNDQMIIEWDFDEQWNEVLAGFELQRASAANGNYQTLFENLPPTQRTATDATAPTTGYYKIIAVGKSGERRASFPYLAQRIDSIPPAPPARLTGTVDTTGLVTLRWTANAEPDVLGYRVFRSNFATHEYTQVTFEAVSDTVFFDTIATKTLTQDIFYKVMAVDQHFNPSDASEVLKLRRPDVIPPVPPVFRSVQASEQGIQLEWINSSSADVANHLLYRRSAGERSWALIGIYDHLDTAHTYLDQEISAEYYYEYTMIAVDSSRWESIPAIPVRSKRINRGIRPAIEEVYAAARPEEKHVALAWNYPTEGVTRFLVYRAHEDERISLYTSVDGAQQEFQDARLTLNTFYRYRVKAVYADGSQSPFSQEIGIRY